MNEKWDLSVLYSDFGNTFENDLTDLSKNIDSYANWINANLNCDKISSIEKIEYCIKNLENIESQLRKLYSFTSLTLSVEATNDEALKTKNKLYKLITSMTEPNVKFERWLNSLENIEDIVNASSSIKKHEFYIKETIQQAKHLLSDDIEILLSKLQENSSSAWSYLQSLLTSKLEINLKIDDKEKTLTLPEVRNLAYSDNAKTRETAYKAEIKAYEKIDDAIAAALSSIKGEVNTISEARGYSSPLDEALESSRMDKSTLEAMITAMKEYLPHFHQYLERKAKLLGYERKLPFYDLYAPIGSISKTFTIEEAQQFIIKNFATFSDKLANLAKRAFNENWIDYTPRSGKVGGAFCANIHPIKQSRILTNFTGNFGDVITLAHELGHGYHGECIFNESMLNASYPMPLAETASTFCETIVMKAVLNEANKEEKISLLENLIQDYTAIICDILSRYIFESEVFEQRKEYSLTSKELQKIMVNAQKASYGSTLDENYMHPFMWLNKPHYYSAELSFYNFPYAFGLLFAKGLYAKYLENKDTFVENYDKLLMATGKMSVEDVANLMDIDVTNIDFWRSSLDIIKADIDEFLQLTK